MFLTSAWSGTPKIVHNIIDTAGLTRFSLMANELMQLTILSRSYVQCNGVRLTNALMIVFIRRLFPICSAVCRKVLV